MVSIFVAVCFSHSLRLGGIKSRTGKQRECSTLGRRGVNKCLVDGWKFYA